MRGNGGVFSGVDTVLNVNPLIEKFVANKLFDA